MIVSCPSCGTHYRHPDRVLPVRARCGKCDATIDRIGLRPYRIEGALAVSRAAEAPPLAASLALAEAVGHPAPAAVDPWDESEPLPAIPEMAHAQDGGPDTLDEPSARRGEADDPSPEARPQPAGLGAVAAWTIAGSILGTGVSWTFGNTTMTGVLCGGLVGLTAAWGWLRWTSRA